MEIETDTNATVNELWRTRLRVAIDARRWNYKQLSIEAGFSDAYVSKMLNGKINPTVDKIQKICQVAEINMSSLFAEDPNLNLVDSAAAHTSDLSEAEAQLLLRLLASKRS